MKLVPVPLLRAISRLEWRAMPGGGTSTYRGGLYCGPGWGFTREDLRTGRIREMPAAIDAIDAACRRHDQCYFDHGYFTRECNVALVGDLVAVIVASESTFQQRFDAAIMAGIFEVESLTMDVGMSVYRDLRGDFERLFDQGLSMEAVIQRQLDDRQLWGY
jgi:hypothetical protein